MSVLLVGNPLGDSNALLAAAWSRLGIAAAGVRGRDVRAAARPGDVLVGRLDVLRSLDGVEPGLLELLLLERGGATVLNGASTLLAAHDKLRTARLLRSAGLPHPRAAHLRPGEAPPLAPPLVLKPRFGSWGADVLRCESPAELARCLAAVASRPWFRRHGALLQELLATPGHDLRLLVAGGEVAGAVRRTAAPGDWRTNVSLGGSRTPVAPPGEARALALAAVRAVDGDLVGVDLLPHAGGWVVIELNGAPDFDAGYSLPGRDVYVDTAEALGLVGSSLSVASSR